MCCSCMTAYLLLAVSCSPPGRHLPTKQYQRSTQIQTKLARGDQSAFHLQMHAMCRCINFVPSQDRLLSVCLHMERSAAALNGEGTVCRTPVSQPQCAPIIPSPRQHLPCVSHCQRVSRSSYKWAAIEAEATKRCAQKRLYDSWSLGILLEV
jgi:hypothetical protein